jgi:hypothetical protein
MRDAPDTFAQEFAWCMNAPRPPVVQPPQLARPQFQRIADPALEPQRRRNRREKKTQQMQGRAKTVSQQLAAHQPQSQALDVSVHEDETREATSIQPKRVPISISPRRKQEPAVGADAAVSSNTGAKAAPAAAAATVRQQKRKRGRRRGGRRQAGKAIATAEAKAQ